jgi:hypothetical protein
MTSFLRVATISAALGVSLVLAGCSSSATPAASDSGTTSTPASAPASAPSSTPASTDASAPAPVPSLNIPEDVLTAFLQASCVAPTSKGGGAGTWDSTALACTTPDGVVTKTDSAKQALTSAGTRAMFVYSIYTKKIASTLPDCPTLAQLEAARNSAAPATSDTCITEALTAVTGYLAKQ